MVKKQQAQRRERRERGKGIRFINRISRRKGSKIPAPADSGPMLKIKLSQVPAEEKIFDAFTAQYPPPLPSILRNAESKDDEQLLPTSRSGRQIRKPNNIEDYASGYDLDHAIQMGLAGEKDSMDCHRPKMVDSTPYVLDTHQTQLLGKQPRRGSGGQSRSHLFQSSLCKVDDETNREPSSETLAPSSPDSGPSTYTSPIEIHEDVYTVMNSLRSGSDVIVDLPPLSSETNPDSDQPYSAKFLTDLYIVCYESQLWNLCDLVIDTWIRAFHALREKGLDDRRYRLWRPNAALERRQRDAEAQEKARAQRQGRKVSRVKGVGYDDCALDYGLNVEDPELEFKVTDFDPTLLYNLYLCTKQDCGARFLWADAMALGGDKMEDMINKKMQHGQTWHPDLLMNIMNSSLRMVRRKLTLKIEEACEGAWCNRYHEHNKHGLPCYRELAWMREREEEKKNERDLVDMFDGDRINSETGITQVNEGMETDSEDESEED